MIRRNRGRRALLLLCFMAAGCDGFLTPQESEVADDALLTIMSVAEDAPPLEATEVSFWIKRGEEREVQISYLTDSGYNGKCVRLVIPADAPLRHADGREFAVGDSALVTVRVVDPELFLFEFDPAGLQFNPAHPARLEIRYTWLADDLNGDGLVDAADEAIANDFELWSQDAPGEPWMTVPSTRQGEIREVHAEIVTFTRYALASD